jgi:hypothetical protein
MVLWEQYMTEKKNGVEQNAIKKAEDIKKLVLERELALQKVSSLEDEIDELKNKIGDIESQLNAFLSFPKADEKKSAKSMTLIPRKGIVLWMAEVMSEDHPMTKEEIVEALKKKGHDVGINSVRSYLTNMDCFENIQISGPKFAKYNKKGWLCHKNRLG